tara:strand:- start:3949 stop:4092 length:144 start_codon:yes stop_codon:yes gene_type:complete
MRSWLQNEIKQIQISPERIDLNKKQTKPVLVLKPNELKCFETKLSKK